MDNVFNSGDVPAKENKSKMIIWLICCNVIFFLYGGMLIVEALFFGGTMHIALVSVLVSSPIIVITFFVFFKIPNMTSIPILITTGTQLIFLSAGTYLQELDFYFFVLLIVLGSSMIMKNFKVLVKCVFAMVIIHITAAIFLLPRLDWLDHYRFFIEFLFFLYAAVFFLILTYSVEQKASISEQSHASFTSLLKSTPNYMVITDSLKRVRYISEPMANFAYFSSRELAVGRPLLDLFSDKKRKLMFADILNSDGFTETVATISIEGEERHFRVIADKLTGIADDAGGLFIDISDITSTVNSKKMAEEAQARAEAANVSKSKFLANMSHEIRTPMNAIIGITQIELQKENLNKEYANALRLIYNSGSSLMGIINDILDLSKIETGKLELAPVVYDIPSLIIDTVQMNMVRIGSKQIDFLIDADRNLPLSLYGDELRIKQILNNLLSNAIKYTEKGHVKYTLRHTAEGRNVTLHITIEDTGQGMKEKDLEKLFSEYQRFNIDANRSTEGTGLGLSIAMKLTRMMDGTIDVQSTYGMGSVFTVTIRQKSAGHEVIGEEISERLRNFTFIGEKQNLKPHIIRDHMPYGNVLVVDDVETNLYVAYGLLVPYKLTIEMANSGFETIDLIKSGKTYDIIFMDHMMPGMDGIEAVQKIRSLGYEGTIVALTANALTGNANIFYSNGFNGFIAKPIDINELNSVLNEFIRDKHPEEAGKYKKIIVEEAVVPAVSSKMLEIFRRDAEKAVETLQKTAANGDMQLFTTTAHAMKSALANVGEIEISKTALMLESAGINSDTEFIAAYLGSFLESLEVLIQNINPAETVHTDNTPQEDGENESHFDLAFLAEQLQVVKSACDNYDDTAVYAALDRLKEKSWDKKTLTVLENIRDMLFLHSDFDGAAELVQSLK